MAAGWRVELGRFVKRRATSRRRQEVSESEVGKVR